MKVDLQENTELCWRKWQKTEKPTGLGSVVRMDAAMNSVPNRYRGLGLKDMVEKGRGWLWLLAGRRRRWVELLRFKTTG